MDTFRQNYGNRPYRAPREGGSGHGPTSPIESGSSPETGARSQESIDLSPEGFRGQYRGTSRQPAPGIDSDFLEWLTPPPPVGRLDVERLAEQAEKVLQQLGVKPEVSQPFCQNVPSRIADIRLQLATLARAQGAAKQRVHLAGLSMQSQWMASYARAADFPAVAQIAGAMEALTKDLHDQPGRLTEATLRSLAHAVELLNALATTSPEQSGRAEGARVLVIDAEVNSRVRILSALERYAVTGVGVASLDMALTLLGENSVDLIVVKPGTSASEAPQLCHAIRRLPQHGQTPLMVLTMEHQWESRAVLSMSGATEVVPGTLLDSELALRALSHFFRGRLSAIALA